MTVKRATHEASTHAPSAPQSRYKAEEAQEGRTTMRKRYRHVMPAAALFLVFTCSRLVKAGSSNKHRLRGVYSFQAFNNVDEALHVIDDMCDGRPRNGSLASGHDDLWSHQCHEHWREADSLSPSNQWTQTEFTNFVQLQSHTTFTDFQQLPLPLTMIFNELSCRCVEHESHDCCHGSNAKILPEDNIDGWMDSICNRVDNALDEVCRRQQQQSRGSEL